MRNELDAVPIENRWWVGAGVLLVAVGLGWDFGISYSELALWLARSNNERNGSMSADGMKREIERQAAIQLKSMLEPAREQIKMEQRKMELERFKANNPEITDDAYRMPIAKMLMERPELRLEDAYYIVKAKVGAIALDAEREQIAASKQARRAALKQTSSGANATPSGTPKFRDAWTAYQFHKANNAKI